MSAPAYLQPVRERAPLALLTLLIGATLALLLTVTPDPRWGYDEAWHLYLSSVTPWTKALEEGIVDAHPPLHHLLLAPLASSAPTPFWLRLPSVLAAGATLLLWYGFLRRLRLARQPALLGTFLLATSFAFLDLGATVRAYSLGMLCLTLGLFGAAGLWRDTAPDCPLDDRMQSEHWSLLLAALGLTLAFALMYAALFVTLSLLLAGLLASAGLKGCSAWRVHPVAWLARRKRIVWLAGGVFLLGHAVILMWFIAGYARARGVSAPLHMEPFLFADGGSRLEFAWSGLRANSAWIMPQFSSMPFGDAMAAGLFWGLAALMLAISWHRRRFQHLVFILAAFLLTAMLLAAGILGIYPFGGMIRHQYVLLPLTLYVMALAIDALWSRLRAPVARHLLAAAVVVFGVLGFGQAWHGQTLGEGNEQPVWAAALIADVLSSNDDRPVYVSGEAFYPVYAAAYPQGIVFRASLVGRAGQLVKVPYDTGWIASLGWGRDWDLYDIPTAGTAPLQILRDRRRWTLPAQPDDDLLEGLNDLMSHLAFDSLRMVRILADDAGPSSPAMLAERYATVHLRVSDFQRVGRIETWVVTRAAPIPTAQ